MKSRRIGILVLTLGMLTGIVNASPPALIPIRMGNEWGYCNPSLEMVIAPRFSEAMPFEGGLAKVKQGKLFGAIDAKGRWILKPEYDAVEFGAAICLKKNGFYSLADRNGSICCTFEYTDMVPVKNGYYLCKRNGYMGLLDARGNKIVPTAYEYVTQLRDDQGNYVDLFEARVWGSRALYDACGGRRQVAGISSIDVFKAGFAVVSVEGKYGLIDLEGNLVVPCEYEQLQGVSEGVAAARVKNRWGFVDTKGREVIPFVYEAVQVGGFYQGRAAVNKAGSWLFVNRKGEAEWPMEGGYQAIGQLSEGLSSACVLAEGGSVRYGYVDVEGHVKVPLRFELAEPFRRGFAIVGMRVANSQSVIREMRYGVIDRNGKTIVPVQLNNQTEARLKRDSLGIIGFASLAHKGRNCRVNQQGHVYDCESDAAYKMQRDWFGTRCEQADLVAVHQKGQWGFCNRSGKIVIPCQYKVVQCFSGGLALVWKSLDPEVYYYIDSSGRAYYKAG
jgi:hypothetical protein